jgi:anti-sigma regulatory factor (Ser/Thr protein kinase)
MSDDYEIATPKPAALIESLRAIGYDLPTAVADIVDNSISAEAKNIDITFHWSGAQSWICIIDDGRGMSELELFEAMRPGSQNPLEKRSHGDLGRFGLGLKTASFSQARRLTVASRRRGQSVCAREWDLDYVERTNEWRLLIRPSADSKPWLEQIEARTSGTAVLWTNLDRLTLGELNCTLD